MTGWRHSLTVRATAMFMLIVVLAAAGLGTYLYRTLVAEIERRDDLQLLGKLRQVQLLLARPGAAELVRTQPDFFRDSMSGQENSLVRFIGADGAVLADINPGGEQFPPLPAATNTATAGGPALADWRGRDGVPGRVAAGAAQLGERPVTVVVARLYAERTAMLAGYRRQIVAAVAISALVAALCAGMMLHRGLRPLRRIAAHADLVRPGTLGLASTGRLDPGHAPSELQPLVTALNAMLARLQEGYARLAGFSADLAHEFRTPITNLLGQSQVLLARPRSTADYEQLLESNIEELERLARMIDSMLFLARAGQHDVMPARAAVPVLDALQRVADFYEGMADERGLRIECLAGAGSVLADPALLRRALANLVSNAVRHADAGSTITLRAEQHAGGTEISVSNHGVPIAPQHLPHLFERFYRADPARGNADGSTGLGLAIVSAIMTLHGGSATVAAEGAENSTTRFVLRFGSAASDT